VTAEPNRAAPESSSGGTHNNESDSQVADFAEQAADLRRLVFLIMTWKRRGG